MGMGVIELLKGIVRTINGLGGNITLTSNGGTVTITTPTSDTINLESAGGGGSSAFSALTSSTNTTAAMVVGTGASLATSGSGTIAATSVTNATLTTALTVNTGTLTLTANVANSSVLTIGAGASSISGTNTGDQTSVSGNAGTATALQNARTIGGVSFDGTANIVPQTIQSINEATDTTCFPLFISASGTQSLQPLNNTALTFNSNTGALGATSFSGAGTGLTGTAASLTAGTVTLNANLTGEATSSGSNAVTLTNSAVIGKVLTGYVSGAGTVAATDTILQAIQKLNGNDATNANLTGVITSVGNATSIASQTGTGTKFVVDTSPTIITPTIAKLANLTTNGFVKTSGGDGTLSVDTASYQPLDSDLTTIAALTATTDTFLQAKASAWTTRTPTQVTADLIVAVGDAGAGGTKGLVPAPATGDATKFLRGDMTYQTVSGAGTVTTSGSPASGNLTTFSGATAITNGDLSGDVTTSGTLVTTIATNAVTNAKAAQMATATFKGRTTAGTGNAEDLTVTQATAMLNVFGASLKGLVPAAAASPSSTKYLSEDGTFTTPAGGGGSGTSIGVAYAIAANLTPYGY
jgi:hypothetical protein